MPENIVATWISPAAGVATSSSCTSTWRGPVKTAAFAIVAGTLGWILLLIYAADRRAGSLARHRIPVGLPHGLCPPAGHDGDPHGANGHQRGADALHPVVQDEEIGRASCRERV